MARFKRGFVSDYAKELEFQAQQEELKRKHGIEEDENVVVVEKDDKVKFAIRLLIAFIRLVLTIVIIMFAVLGVFALVYQNSRTPILDNLMLVKEQIISVFN